MAQITGRETGPDDNGDANYFYVLEKREPEFGDGRWVEVTDYKECSSVEDGLDLAEVAFEALYTNLTGRYRKTVSHRYKDFNRDWAYQPYKQEYLTVKVCVVRE